RCRLAVFPTNAHCPRRHFATHSGGVTDENFRSSRGKPALFWPIAIFFSAVVCLRCGMDTWRGIRLSHLVQSDWQINIDKQLRNEFTDGRKFSRYLGRDRIGEWFAIDR